ncbi:MAG: hypothetical protein NVV72_15430 [Asticcacaulis sp.]|nr:hypothetical protein [Asticcacaulis sp.]
MADLTGDSQGEIIIDAQTIGTWEEYIKPAVGHRLTIFQLKRGEWQSTVRMRLCQTELATVGNGQINFPAQALDMLWINGHAVNFFDSDCMVRENTIPAPAGELNQARAMAPLLTHIARLPLSKPLPESLAKALADRTIVLPWATEPPMRETWMKPAYHGLPPCFTSHNPKACMAMVSDINHDGSDDVVILDRNVRKDVSTWRLATLLMVRQGRWTVVASHAACAEEGQKPEDLKVEFKPSTWHPVEFAGRLYMPDEQTDTCTQHYPIL